MKTSIGLVLAGLFLAACATTDAPEPAAVPTQAPAETAKEADAATDTDAAPECDPADSSCDHTGTVFRPPTR